MSMEASKCTECNTDLFYSYHIECGLCYDCYEKMFVDEEITLKHETAVATPMNELHGPVTPADLNYVLNMKDGKVLSKGFRGFTMPKSYKVDFSKVNDVNDYLLLLKAILSEDIFLDNHKEFDSFKHLLKEEED